MKGMFSLRIKSSSLASSRLGHLARETYAPERPKCHISDVKDRLHNLSGSYGVSNENLFAVTFSWSTAIKFWVILRTSGSKLTQMLFLKKKIV